MRNKLSFDLQLAPEKRQSLNGLPPIKLPAVSVGLFNGDVRWRVYGDRIYFYLSVIADAPSSQALTHLVGGFALHSALFCWRFVAPACSPLGNDGDGKKSGRY